MVWGAVQKQGTVPNWSELWVVVQGMVMVSPEMNPTICSVFEAEIVLLFHATTFRKGFQVTVHVGNVRQTAIVEKIHGKVGMGGKRRKMDLPVGFVWIPPCPQVKLGATGILSSYVPSKEDTPSLYPAHLVAFPPNMLKNSLLTKQAA